MFQKIRNYLIAIVLVFLIVLLVGYFFVDLTWGESALLSAFLTAIGVGSYWWKEEGLG
jgi:O-antigen/teichoic acid export membrane protein